MAVITGLAILLGTAGGSSTAVASGLDAGSAVSASPRFSGSIPRTGTATADRWTWPVPTAMLVRGYEAPAHRYGAGHRGIDLAAAPGAEVTSPADGVVRFAGVVVDRPVVSIDHGGGIVSSFEPVSPGVVEGQRVRRGDPIGVVASADHCAPERSASGCLHLGARLNGEYFSPLALLGDIPRAVLLPVD